MKVPRSARMVATTKPFDHILRASAFNRAPRFSELRMSTDISGNKIAAMMLTEIQ